MATFFVNGVTPVEVVAAAAVEHLQVVSGEAYLVEGADPTIGIISAGETLLFDGLTAAVNALSAKPDSYCVIRTTGATQIANADGADEGTPGAFTAAGEQPPLRFSGMSAITANPTDIWAEGTHVFLSDGSTAYWDGTAWQEGIAPTPPLATGADAGVPGAFTPAGSSIPFDLAAMAPVVANPLTLWTVGQNVVMGDTNPAHWDGAAWAAGVAPA